MSQMIKRKCKRVIRNCLWHTNNTKTNIAPIKQWNKKKKMQQRKKNEHRLLMGHKIVSIVITGFFIIFFCFSAEWLVYASFEDFICFESHKQIFSSQLQQISVHCRRIEMKEMQKHLMKQTAEDQWEIYFSNKWNLSFRCVCAVDGLNFIWSLVGIISLWCSFNLLLFGMAVKTNCKWRSIRSKRFE